MTVASETSSASYTCNGVTTTFAVPFRILEAAHIRVFLTDALGTEDVQVLNTDYTVTSITDTGANVVMTTAPATSLTLVIERDVPITQETAYTDGGKFPAESHEAALDKLTMIAQQLQASDVGFAEGLAQERAERIAADIAINARIDGLTTGPGILYPEINPFNYGATGGDPVKDTAGWLAALADARLRGRPVVPSGTTVLKTPETKSFDLYTNREAYVAIPMQSGDRIYTKDATVFLAPPTTWTPTGGPTGAHIWIFGTEDWSMIRGANGAGVEIEGLTVDMSPDEYSRNDTFHYAFGFLSFDDLRRKNVRIISSGQNAGRGGYFANTRYRRDEGLVHDNLRQGMYTHYDYGLTARDLRFKQLRECLDLDAMQEASFFRDLIMYDPYIGATSESDERQGIDMSPGRDVSFIGIHADHLKTAFQVYSKSFIPATFADYVQAHEIDEVFVTPSLPSRNVLLSDFRFIECGQNDVSGAFGSEDIKINVPRNNSGGADPETTSPVATNIRVEKGVLYRGHGIRCHEGDGVFIEGIEAIECSGNDSFGSGGDIGTGGDLNGDWDFVIYMGQEGGPIGTDADRDSRLRGTLRDVYIKDARGGGVYLGGANEFVVSNLIIDGYGQSPGPYNNKGFYIAKFGQKENSNLKLNELIKIVRGPVGGADFRIGGQSTAPAGVSIIDMVGANLVADSIVMNLSDRVRLKDSIDVDIRSETVTGADFNRIILPAIATDQYYYVHTIEISNRDALAGDPTNYINMRLIKLAGGTRTALGGTAFAYNSTAVAADTRRVIAYDLDPTVTTLGPGEALALEFYKSGTGDTIANATLTLRGFWRRKAVAA